MSTAYTKEKLKQSKESLTKKQWQPAAESANQVLQHEPNNYNANVFLGLACLNLGRLEQSEHAYNCAVKEKPNQLLAWQGLQGFYTETKQWQKLGQVLRRLMDLHEENRDATRCAEVYQRLLQLERQEGGNRSLVAAIELMLPGSKYYPTLSSLDPPDQTNPGKTTTFDIQMAIHITSLQVLQEMINLTERLEKDTISKETEKRRMRLDGANKGKQALENQVILEVYTESKLASFYEQVLAHPKADDELRRETEAKLFRRQIQLLTAYPSSAPKVAAPIGTAAINPEKAAAQVRQEQEITQKKAHLCDQIIKMAQGMVIINVDDELAWEIVLEWTDQESLLDLPLERLRKFISLFPRSGRSKAFTALLLLIRDQQFLKERDEYEKEHNVEFDRSQDADLLTMAIDALEDVSGSILTHRIAAVLYLLDRDFGSAAEVAESALALTKSVENEASISLSKCRMGISSVLLTALTQLDPPQNHAKALRLVDSILKYDQNNVDAILAKGYIEQFASRWSDAKTSFERVCSMSPSGAERILTISPDPVLEARIESAWCDVHLSLLPQARTSMQTILDQIDPITLESVSSETRAKIWWRLGRCLWSMGGELRTDPSHAFTCFITALKRNPAYAPAYTSLGIYYETIASPPDIVRASKCFQKAFELDAREVEAARRLAEGFADEREWDLVQVVARRTIQGEGGNHSPRHQTQNAWAWKAVGSVELSKKRYENAILAFQIALRSQPEDRRLWQRLGEAYAAAGRHMAALKCFAKTEGDWQARYCIGDVQRQLGKYDLAIEIFENILEGQEEVGVRVTLADTLLLSARKEYKIGYVARAEGSLARCLEQARRVLEKDNHLRSAWKIVADACFLLSKFGSKPHISVKELTDIAASLETDAKLPSITAVTHSSLASFLHMAVYLYKLRVVLNASDDNLAPSAWADLSVSIYRLGTCTRQAIGCIKEALRHEPGNESYWILLGNLTFESSVKLAQHSFIRAAESAQKSPIPWTLLGFLYMKHGDVELANEAFIRAQTADPDYAEAWVGQALVAAHFEDDRASRVLFQHAASLSEGSLLEADYGFAHAVHTGQDPNVSLHPPSFALSAYLSHSPEDVDALHLSALFCERLGQYALAISRIEKAASLLEAMYEQTEDPIIANKYAVANSNLGRIRLQAGDNVGALEAFQATLGLAQEGAVLVQAHLGSALAQFELGDTNAAFESFEAAGSGAEIVVHLARALWKMGEKEQAKSRLLESVAETPNEVVTETLMAIALVEDDQDLLEAAVTELAASSPLRATAAFLKGDKEAVLAQATTLEGAIKVLELLPGEDKVKPIAHSLATTAPRLAAIPLRSASLASKALLSSPWDSKTWSTLSTLKTTQPTQ